LVLWAWERPIDLRSLDSRIGVAFLAQTITLDDDGPRVAARRQPLRVADAARVIAVTRVEAAKDWRPPLRRELSRAVARLVADAASLPRVRAVQLDFDARLSERDFYRQLIRDVRAALPASTALSMTALASWCRDDAWLGGLPVDEIVPMLFEMGPGDRPYRHIASARSAANEHCRQAVGVSLGEPLATRSDGRRVYVFNSSAWTEQAVAAAKRMGED
jgi:hypothetical protein